MNSAVAKSKFVRISPQKARIVADLIRGLFVEEALEQLVYSRCKAGRLILKTLHSAVANAEYRDARRENLKVTKIFIDEGPRWKRSLPVSKGRSHPILKRTSHITVEVGE